MWIPVAVGGVVGTLARFAVQLLIPTRSPGEFPVATLFVNLLGSFVLGFVMGHATSGTIGPRTQAALAIGFCGAFTTMSTFGYETLMLFSTQAYGRAAIYLVGTLLGSLACVALGLFVQRAS